MVAAAVNGRELVPSRDPERTLVEPRASYRTLALPAVPRATTNVEGQTRTLRAWGQPARTRRDGDDEEAEPGHDMPARVEGRGARRTARRGPVVGIIGLNS